jgi:hypothetical protein
MENSSGVMPWNCVPVMVIARGMNWLFVMMDRCMMGLTVDQFMVLHVLKEP